jgi:adhesin HecA-like repeat protein
LQGVNNQNSEQVTNKAGTIEAKGDITVKTDELNNIGEDNPSDHEKIVEITGTPAEVEFTGGYAKKVKVGGYIWNKWNVMYEYQVESSLTTTPAYLLSGGSINIHNANLYNYGSLISAAGDIDINGGSVKNETGAIKLQFDKYQFLGCKWQEKRKRNPFGGHYHVTLYSSKWQSGEAIAKSANPAIIEASGDINIETTEITNTDTAGFETISEEKKSEQINSAPVTISYNKDIIDKITTSGISIKYQYTKTGLQTLGDFYGSNYFLSRINFNPEKAMRKLILPIEEAQREIRQAIFEATAKRFLHKSVTTDAQQLRILMDNAVKANQNLEIALGVALTPEEIKALDEDIIWYGEEEINGVKILVPRIYLSRLTLDSFIPGTSIIKSGGKLNLSATGDITNTGKIKSGAELKITAKNITNKTIGDGKQAGITSDGEATLTARNNITNTGGAIKGGSLTLTTETGDITNQTQVNTIKFTGAIKSYAGQTATIESGVVLTMNSGANLLNTGATISSIGDAILNAKQNITLASIQLKNRDAIYFDHGHIISAQT